MDLVVDQSVEVIVFGRPTEKGGQGVAVVTPFCAFARSIACQSKQPVLWRACACLCLC